MTALLTTEHDAVIKNKINHFNNFPEMLPFIGKNYMNMTPKIFVLGESHYWDKKEIDDINNKAGDNRFIEDWYNQNSLEFSDRQKIYISARCNIEKVESDKIQASPLTSYYNIRKELKENLNLIEKDKVFSNFVYFNYFQRPAIESGKSIQPDVRDNKAAYDTLKSMAEILKPNKIIFATIKGWDAFDALRKEDSATVFGNIELDFVPHASCKWWNTESKRYGKKNGKEKMKGREKFISLLNG